MTRDEVKTIVALFKTAFPQWKLDDPTNTVNTWAVLMSDYDYRTMQMAVKRFMATSNSAFPPSIPQLIEQYRICLNGEIADAAEEWANVRKAIGRAYYYASAEFEKLSPIAQKVVGSPDVLRTWSQQSMESMSAIEGRFVKAYKECANREREVLSLSPQFRSVLEQKVQEQKALCDSLSPSTP